jgi:alkanesulfonate monooxygenase SsuD/methylene tetrahydromethanopterin reductase-like flavin-dependent oxidoreductase (luciferase family)
VGEHGDGWLATAITDPAFAERALGRIRAAAEAVGRDPDHIGLQQMLDVPPRDAGGKAFYSDLDQVARRAEQVVEMGFQWTAVNATAVFQSGARSIDAMIETLGAVHERVRGVTG